MKPISKKREPAILERIYKELEDGILNRGSDPFNTLIEADYVDLETEEKTKTKNEVQEALADEQGWICCYCNQEITKTNGLINMKIEHYKPESIYNGQIPTTQQFPKLCSNNRNAEALPDLRIDYTNLLCACKGQHCDDSGFGKGDWELCSIPNPTNVAERDFQRTYEIFYSNEGYIYSKKRCNNNLENSTTCFCSCENEDSKRGCLNWELGGCINSKGEFVKGRLNLNTSYLKEARKYAWSAVLKEIASKVFGNYKLAERNWRKEFERKPTESKKAAKELLDRYSQRRKKDNKFYPFCMYVIYRLKKEFDL